MAQVPIDLTRLVSQLNVSGLSQRDQPLYQVIKQLIEYLRQTQISLGQAISAGGGGGSSGGGITQLTTDVVAVGPGIVPAVIQPNVVTYGKIQDVVDGQRLLGSEFPAQDVIELALGPGLGIAGGVIEIQQPGGGVGLVHNLLSPTHPDTAPASPIIGDLIRAVEGVPLVGEYYGFTVNAPIVESFSGIRFGYGFGSPFVGTYFGYTPPALAYVPVTPPDTLLAWEYIDFFILSKLVENFQGIRAGYTKTFDYLTGNNYGYYPPAFAFIVPPSPANPLLGARWQRMGIGVDGQILTVVAGQPEWADGEVCEIPVVCPWVSIPFNAGDFTASGGIGPAWTVDLADVIRWEYQVFSTEGNLNNSVRIALYLRDTTVAGTAPTQLRIQLPFTLSGNYAQIIGLQENLVSQFNAFVAYSSGNAFLTIQKIPFGGAGPPFDTTASATFLSFEISAKVTDLEGCFHECSGGGGGSGGGPAVPLPHHITHETGGSDQIVDLSGSVITTGTVADARLSSNVALKNINNLFSAAQDIVLTNPFMRFNDTGSPVDQRLSRFLGSGGFFFIQCLNDAETVNQALISASRFTGAFTNHIAGYFEYGRANGLGNWIAPAFNAAHYYSDGGQVWTVAVGDVLLNKYTLIGKTMIWSLLISGSAVSGVPGPFIYVTLPDGLVATTVTTGPITGLSAGAALAGVYQGGAAAGTAIYLFHDALVTNWPNGSTTIRATIVLEIT